MREDTGRKTRGFEKLQWPLMAAALLHVCTAWGVGEGKRGAARWWRRSGSAGGEVVRSAVGLGGKEVVGHEFASREKNSNREEEEWLEEEDEW